MGSQPPGCQLAGIIRSPHPQQQQQQYRPLTGPRFTSTPTLASQTEFSPQAAQRSASGLQSPVAQEGASPSWGNASQVLPHQSSYLSQQVPSQSSNLSQSIFDEASNASQGILIQGSDNRQFMPAQSNSPLQDSNGSPQPATANQGPQASAPRTLQFSDTPLLQPSTSNASQPAHDMGADAGGAQNGWGAYQQAQPLQADQAPAASTSQMTFQPPSGKSACQVHFCAL